LTEPTHPRPSAPEELGFETIVYEKAPPRATITLNRPEVLNAFDFRMLREITRACEDASWDDDVRVVVITGNGRAFCVGALDAFGQFTGVVLDSILLRHLGGRILITPDERGDLHVGNALQRVEMFLAECALPGDADPHAAFLAGFLPGLLAAALRPPTFLRTAGFAALPAFSRMMWPTAVLDAGTV